MKRKDLMVATTGIMVMLLSGSGYTFQNEPRGFRDLRWGQRRTPDMVFFGEDYNAKHYKRPDDELTLGKAKLTGITYNFLDQGYRQSFMAVFIEFDNEESYNILVNICKEKFGKPTKELMNELLWVGANASVRIDYGVLRKYGTLLMGDRRLSRKYLAEREKQQGKEAEKDW